MDRRFPMELYVQAFQNKYANEQAAKPNLLNTAVQGITSGATMALDNMQKEKELKKQRLWEGYTNYTKDRKLVSAFDDTIEAPIETVAQVNEDFYQGKYKSKGDKDKNLLLADGKGNAQWKWVMKNPELELQSITPTPEDIAYWKEKLPGYTWEVGRPTSVNRKEYQMVVKAANPAKPVESLEDRLNRLREEKRITAEENYKVQNAGMPVSKPIFEMEQKMGDDFRRDIRDYPLVKDSYIRILEATKDQSAGSDIALVFAYMKMLDPNSVVRESEYATAENAGSVPERIRAKYNKLLQGERLDPNVRKDFIDVAGRLYDGAERTYKSTYDNYSERCRVYGLDPKRALTDHRPSAESVPSRNPAPAPASPAPVVSASDFKVADRGVAPAPVATPNPPHIPPPSKPGGVLMEDAQGNKAYKYPDGSYEEIR